MRNPCFLHNFPKCSFRLVKNWHQNSLLSVLLVPFPIDSFVPTSRYSSSLGPSATSLFARFSYFGISHCREHSSNSTSTRCCSYNLQCIPLTLCTLIIYVSLTATALTICNGFLCNYHGENGLSCRSFLEFGGAT